MMDVRIRRGAVREERRVGELELVLVKELEEVVGSMKWKPMEQKMRPTVIMGMEMRRMRRRPIRSIRTRAAQVRTKFVRATERDVSVGEEKPRMVKMVAEKYISEFCCVVLV
jgi:hypothetical protein